MKGFKKLRKLITMLPLTKLVNYLLIDVTNQLRKIHLNSSLLQEKEKSCQFYHYCRIYLKNHLNSSPS